MKAQGWICSILEQPQHRVPVGRTPVLKIGPVILNLPSTEYPPHWIRTKYLLLFQRGTRTDHSLWLPSRVFCNSSARGPSRQSSGFSRVRSLEKDGLSFYKKQWLVVEVGVIPEFQASIFSELKKVYMCCYNSGIDNFCCSYYSYCKRFFFFFQPELQQLKCHFCPEIPGNITKDFMSPCCVWALHRWKQAKVVSAAKTWHQSICFKEREFVLSTTFDTGQWFH